MAVRRLTRSEMDEANARGASAPSTRLTLKQRDDAQENTTVDKHETKKHLFDSITLPGGREITKSADVAEFEYRDGVLRRVDPMIKLDSPKPEDGLRAPHNPASSFPVQSGIVDRPTTDADSVTPLEPYEMVEPDPTSAGTYPSMLNFLAAGAPGNIPEPAMFSPSQPGRMPTNPGGDAKDTRTDTAPLLSSTYQKDNPLFKTGSGMRILKSEFDESEA